MPTGPDLNYVFFYAMLVLVYGLGYMTANRGRLYRFLDRLAHHLLGGDAVTEQAARQASMRRHPSVLAPQMRAMLDAEGEALDPPS